MLFLAASKGNYFQWTPEHEVDMWKSRTRSRSCPGIERSLSHGTDKLVAF